MVVFSKENEKRATISQYIMHLIVIIIYTYRYTYTYEGIHTDTVPSPQYLRLLFALRLLVAV